MHKQLKQSIKTAAVNREMIVVWLHGGGKAKGIPEVSANPDRVKINTIEGPVWVPYVDMKSISPVIRLRVEGETNE
ncbi:hypothetical protein MKX42_10310 [Paenibacillus sp. FSL R7-0204]|uniref:hypothetical protein n=1 Tax=Paenibacillus sp. FSL R7-0204 TaxID=2921675 RepID=UPI0030F503BD